MRASDSAMTPFIFQLPTRSSYTSDGTSVVRLSQSVPAPEYLRRDRIDWALGRGSSSSMPLMHNPGYGCEMGSARGGSVMCPPRPISSNASMPCMPSISESWPPWWMSWAIIRQVVHWRETAKVVPKYVCR